MAAAAAASEPHLQTLTVEVVGRAVEEEMEASMSTWSRKGSGYPRAARVGTPCARQGVVCVSGAPLVVV